MLGCATWLALEPLEAGIINPQRFAQVLGLFQTVVIAGWMVAWLAGVGPDGIQNTSAAWVEEPVGHLSWPLPSSRPHRAQPLSVAPM